MTSFNNSIAPFYKAFTPPQEMTGEGRRFAITSLVGAVMGLTVHLALLAVFGLFELWVLVAFNAFSVAAYVLIYLLAMRGRFFIGTFLAGVELVLHAVIATFWLGLDAGFHYYVLLITVVALLVPRFDYRLRLVVALASIALLIALVAWGSRHTAIASIDSNVILAFALSNMSGLALVIVAIVFTWVIAANRAEAALADEHARSESLLANMMPAPVAARLKATPGTIAERHEDASVLFADIVDFTSLAGRMPAETVVGLLDDVFSAFDALVEARGLEKIKTIGDAYMVVAGIPAPRPDHAEAIVDLAGAMMDEITRHRDDRNQSLRLRIGINSGQVVAGVIGRRKLAYDLWGDTVNMAARMESTGQVGSIQLTQATRDLLPPSFVTIPRDTVEVKGKGAVKTYLLKLA